MANTPSTGTGPFEFTDSNGRQVSIPLTAFTFDATTGNLIVNPLWSGVTSVPPASTLLPYVIAQKFIAPAVLPSPVPAMVVKAADPGAAGNNIQVVIAAGVSNPDPTLTTFSIAITETDFYTDLSCATIEAVLGSGDGTGGTVKGSLPGLVQVLKSSINLAGVPAAGSYPLTVPGAPPPPPPLATTARVDVIDGSSAKVFTLFAKKDGPDGSDTVVTISAGSSATTFNLQAVWTKPAVTGVTLANLATTVQALKYEIAVAPPGGGAFSVPVAGPTNLSGGGPGSTAQATLFAG